MKKTLRLLALLATVCMLLSVFATTAVMAASPEGEENDSSIELVQTPVVEEEDGAHVHYAVQVAGGTVRFANGETFEGTAHDGDILIVTLTDVPGRTFAYWVSVNGVRVPDKEFTMAVHGPDYLYPVFEDTDEDSFGPWTVLVAGDCEEGTLYVRQNTQGETQYKREFVNRGMHDWQPCFYVDEDIHKQVCSICGKEEISNHNYSEFTVTEPATHEHEGLKTGTCYGCGHVVTQVIPKTDEHVMGPYTIVEKSEKGQYGIRERKCLYCDYTERYWYLEPDFYEFFHHRYVEYENTYGGKVTNWEKFFNWETEDGRDVYVFALQYVYSYSSGNDYGQTFVFMFLDDHDPMTQKPVYLTKSRTTDGMMAYSWSLYYYVNTFDDWISLIGSLDTGSGSNTMGGRSSILVSFGDDWANTYNNMLIPVDQDPESFLVDNCELEENFKKWQIAYEGYSRRFDVTDYDTKIYEYKEDGTPAYEYQTDAEGNILTDESGQPLEDTTKQKFHYNEEYVYSLPNVRDYKRWVSTDRYGYKSIDYLTVDLETGVTFSEVISTTAYSTRMFVQDCREILTSEEFEQLEARYQKAYFDQGQIESNLNSFFTNQNRNAFYGFTLAEPEKPVGYRMFVWGPVKPYEIYYYNFAKIYPVPTSQSEGYSRQVKLTWSGYEVENYTKEFVCWEIYNRQTGEYEVLSYAPVILVNTFENPLTDLTIIRAVEKPIEASVHVRVEGGYFVSTADTSKELTDYTFTYIPTINLYSDYVEGMEFDHWEDEDGNTVSVSNPMVLTEDAVFIAKYRPQTYYRDVSVYDRGLVYRADDEENATSYMTLEEPAGTVIHLGTKRDEEDTDSVFYGWYVRRWGKSGEIYELLSTELTLDYTMEATYDYSLVAVWTPDEFNPSGEETVIIRAQGGLMAVRFYEMEEGGFVPQNAYSSVLLTGSGYEINLFDDPTDDLVVGKWEKKFFDAYSGEETTEEIYSYYSEGQLWAYFQIYDLEQIGSDPKTILVVGSPVEPCAEDAHNWDSGVITKEPTHTEEGVITYTCSVCGSKKTEPVDKTTEHEFGDWVDDRNGTTHTHRCECGETETENHTWDNGRETTPATHTTEGVRTFTCTACGATKTEPIDKTTEHAFGDWVDDRNGTTHTHACACGETETEDHTWDNGQETTPATHTSEGVRTFTCTVCGATKTEPIDKTTEHAFGDWVDDQNGTTHTHTCECGETETENHTWDNGQETTPATHTSEGVRTFTCRYCGATKTEPIDKIAEHSFDKWEDDQNGTTHTHRCECGETETENHTWDNGRETTPATHTSEGVRTFTCTVCGATKTEPIDKTTEHEFGRWTDDQNGTTHTHRCECGETETENHTWDNGRETTPATHTSEGVRTFTCTACGATKTEPIDKIAEHSFDKWEDDQNGTTHTHRCECGETETENHIWDNGQETTPATHTSEGVRTFTCTVCGATKTEPIDKTTDHEFGRWTDDQNGTTHTHRCECGETETENHTWDNGRETTPATHTAEGVRTFTCTVCGATKTEPIDKTTNHEFGDWADDRNGKTHSHTCECGETETENHTWDNGRETTPATHTSEGVRTFTCRYCGATRTEKIEKLSAHAFTTWADDQNGKTHSRVCECGEKESEDHAWNNGEVTTPATHTSEGVRTFTCTVCGATRTETIDKTTEHAFGDWVDDGNGKTHSRVCECGEKESAEHVFVPSETTEYLICECGATQKAPETGKEPNVDVIVNEENIGKAHIDAGDAGLENLILTEEEYLAVQNGAKLEVALEVKDASASVKPEDKALMEQNLGDFSAGMYLDITLTKQIGDGPATAVSETKGKISISMQVPQELDVTDKEIKVFRLHDKVVTALDVQHDKESNTLTFETDQFSTYLLAMRDAKDGSKNEKHGCKSMMAPMALLLTVCFASAVVAGRKRKD